MWQPTVWKISRNVRKLDSNPLTIWRFLSSREYPYVVFLKVNRRFGRKSSSHIWRVSQACSLPASDRSVTSHVFNPEDGEDIFLWTVTAVQRTMRCYILEDITLHKLCGILNSYSELINYFSSLFVCNDIWCTPPPTVLSPRGGSYALISGCPSSRVLSYLVNCNITFLDLVSIQCKIWSLHGGDYEECRLALVRTDVSEENSASIIRVTRIGELETTLAVTSSMSRLLVTANVVPSSPTLVTLMMGAQRSSETSVLTRATRRNVPEDCILLCQYPVTL
jgi:hypothetical protein